ncbi:thioredoxin domain-containing protein [Geoglobus acetivorans]|uniref:Thioredoxin family protein n=1 Tax=Geoglobus acetivorans TaxID=565033 RepID=A0ABZ3H5S5_GEOAI|nr:thioredoxin family protein [Geoglobus acetivorans]
MKKKPVLYLVTFLSGVLIAMMLFLSAGGEYSNQKPEALEGAKMYYFYADWCPHCQKVKPYVTEMAKSYDIVFCNLTAGENTLSQECLEIAKQVRIPGVPTILAVKDNKGYLFVGEDQILNLTRAAGIEVKE